MDFLAAWTDLTDQLEELADDAAAAGHSRTAGELYFRATNYLCNAERMQSEAAILKQNRVRLTCFVQRRRTER